MSKIFVPAKPSIYTETLDSLTARFKESGLPAFRATQVMEWLYGKRVDTFDAMTNVPVDLRNWLKTNYVIMPCESIHVHKSGDVTEKILFQLEDKQLIETVLIRYPQEGVGLEHSRKTVCISTQVGCAYACKFCASGLNGWKRDLLAAEIIAQLMHICRMEALGSQRNDGIPFDNIVVMGMGEPLSNYENVLHALTTLNADWGLKFGSRRITVSTSGLAPQIIRLSEEPVQFRLAISLHGATDEVRNQIMPINKRYPLDVLIPAVKQFTEKHGRMITLEYILIEDVNDSFDQAEKLGEIAADLHAHVNLIPYNTVEGLAWKRPNIRRQQKFADVVRSAGASVTIRKEKGDDISAACGQLKLRKENEIESLKANDLLTEA